ncbi:MAG: outer membrane lipoprotein carrier protein LolA [Phycisphaerales bacterium]|nr:outer membrane lipoprotein carrier protein LolA [Phycisphaerales bacterium]
MYIKKTAVSILFFLLSTSLVFAQTESASDGSDPVAAKLLQSVSQHLKSLHSIAVDFTFTNYDRSNIVRGTASGTITIKGNDCKIVQGDNLTLYCSGTDCWRIDKEAQEINLSKLDDNTMAFTPQKIFTDFYNKDFLYRENSVKDGIAEIQMTPIDKRQSFHTILLYIDTKKLMIVKVKVIQNDNTSLVYTFNKVVNNPAISDAQIKFNQSNYPAYDLIDNR